MDSFSSLTVEELARRCSSSGEVAAWEEFVRRLHRLIAKVVVRAAARMGDASKQTVDDLIQETYFKFCADNCRLLRNFDHRHPGAFIGYVQVVAANVARDHFRSAYARSRAVSGAVVLEMEVLAASDDSAGGAKAIERSVLMEQVGRHLEMCVAGPDRDRNSRVFWLYYRAGLSAAAIAILPGIDLTTKGVESLILRLTRELRARMAGDKRAANGPSREAGEGILPAESF